MAATLTRRQTDKARSLIQTERLVEELQKHVDGKREMTPSQVRAAQILLDRSLPCLVSQTFSTDDDPTGLPILTIVRNASDTTQAA